MPHCLRVASDVDHANTTSVSFFHEDATVLFGGPCRLCVLLNGSSNSGSLIQNGNCISSYTLSAHKILSSTSTHSSEESCVGLHYSCETRALRGERPVFCHRKHSILARRRQQDVSQPALLAWVVYGEGMAASVLGKKVGLWGQSEPPSQARRCSELCAFGPCGEGSQKPSHWHYIAALPGLHVKMPPLASTVFLGQAVDKLFDLSSASLCGREPIRAHLVPGHSWPFLSGH